MPKTNGKVKGTDGLTPKQMAFCGAYIKLGNTTQAAKEAGYSKKTAKSIATENLSKPHHIRIYQNQDCRN